MCAYYAENKEDIMALANVSAVDGRTHSTVFHKSDSRVNNLIRRHKKGDIIRLYDIDCTMLFKVDTADIQFDMFENYRPYIVFRGNAEGVFLEERTGLLFPNRCDQLDFRPDFTVPTQIEYVLADIELATLAANGLFNGDYSCQGRIIGSTLEIPCKIDYYAIANTPLTFIEIHDRMNIKTSTRRTGYKTLVASFTPYNAQKHNAEDRPKLIKPAIKDNSKSAIRQRDLYDSKAVGFNTSPSQRTMQNGADFIEVAQSRIQQRLQEAMQQGNVLSIDVAETSNQIAGTVQRINSKKEQQRAAAVASYEGNTDKINNAALDARLNDMATRMVYAGAGTIPVKVDEIKAKPLVEAKPDNQNDEIMARPTTKVTSTVGSDPVTPEVASNVVDTRTSEIHEQMFEAEVVASDITKTLDRKKKLMDRRQQRLQVQQNAIAAGEEEAKKDMTSREPDFDPKAPSVKIDKSAGGNTQGTARLKAELKDDILAGGVDIDAIINSVEK
jgi:hypothetical protein